MPSDFNKRPQTTDNNPGWRDGHLAIPDAERLAYERGVRDGLEAAAKLCEDRAKEWTRFPVGGVSVATARAIRALPVPEEP